MTSSRRFRCRAAAAVVATALATTPVLAPTASAEERTVTFQVTVPQKATSWSDTAALPRFNPTLGELRTVGLQVDTHLAGTTGVENLTTAPATLTATLSATTTVARPGPAGAVITTQLPSASSTLSLGAFDGAIDYTGTSGQRPSLTNDRTAVLLLV
jgi:hypothetical protein